MTLGELMETDTAWVERLRELRYQASKQGVQLL